MHNLSVNKDGQHEMFVAGKPAWHHLGVNVADAVTWEEASKLAKLDWTIGKHQLSNPVTGDLIDSYALCREDDGRWLSTVGKAYKVIQNSQCFEMTDALIGTGKARFVSAGALGRGEVVWCLAKLSKNFSPVKGDDHETYLLFTDSRNGRAARGKLTFTRVVCQNTLTIALDEKIQGGLLKIYHNGTIDEKIKTAISIISTTENEIDAVSEKLAELTRKNITADNFNKVMTRLFPSWKKDTQSLKKVETIANNFEYNDGGKIAGIEGTAYSLLQSITRFIDHQRNGFPKDDSVSPEVRRSEYAMFGSGDALKTMAVETICEAVNVDWRESNKRSIQNILSTVQQPA